MKKDITTTYTWPTGSVIKRIDVREQKNGFAVAYLYADDREEQRDMRTNIRAAIRLKGWGTLSDSRDGEFVLRVAGLRSGDKLISALQAQGFIGAPHAQTTKAADDTPAETTTEKIRNNSLRLSGAIATVGNALSISSGVHRSMGGQKNWGQIGKGFFFSLADLPLMIAGGRDDGRQLQSLLKQLTKTYVKEGIEIPSTTSIKVETSDKGKTFGERSMDYLHRYANQIKCSMEVAAAGMGIWAGKTQLSKFKEKSPYFWGTGFLASLLIPERKIDPERYGEAGLLGRAWMNIQSNPLAIGGLLGYTNNIGDYLSSSVEKKKIWAPAAEANAKLGLAAPPKLYRWDSITPSVMLSANGLYAISKKTVGGNIDSDAMVQDAYRIASQIINKQPPELREKAIETTSRFFGQRMEIKETYQDARTRLVKELDSQRQNPWFENVNLPPRTPKKSRDVVIQDAPLAPVSLVQASDIQHHSKGIAASHDSQYPATANAR